MRSGPVLAPRSPRAGDPAIFGRTSLRRRPSAYDPDTSPQIDHSFDQSVHYDDVDRPLIGLRVRHNQFGDGQVVASEGQGPNAKLTVRFPSVGLKRVIARFLTPMG